MTFPPPILLAEDLNDPKAGRLFKVQNRRARRARAVIALRDGRRERRARVARTAAVVEASPDPLATSGQPGEERVRDGVRYRWVPDFATPALELARGVVLVPPTASGTIPPS